MKKKRYGLLKVLFLIALIVISAFLTQSFWYPYSHYVKKQVSKIKPGMNRYEAEKILREIKPELSKSLLDALFRRRHLVCGAGMGPQFSLCKKGKCIYPVEYCGAWYASWRVHVLANYEGECKEESCIPPAVHFDLPIDSSNMYSNDTLSDNIEIIDNHGNVLYKN